MRTQQIQEMATSSKRIQFADESNQLAVYYMRLAEIACARIDNSHAPLKDELKRYTIQLLLFFHNANQEALFTLTRIPMNLP